MLSAGVPDVTIELLKIAPTGPVRKNAATVLARLAKHPPVHSPLLAQCSDGVEVVA